MLETILSIGGGALGMGGNLASMYSAVSSIGTGKWQKELLELLREQKAELIKLNEHISYAPGATPVRVAGAEHVVNLRDLRQLLDPVQQALGQDIISSATFLTPRLLQQQFKMDPWNCLDGIQPIHLAAFDRGPDWIPLLFSQDDMVYVGWQKKGMLSSVLGLEFSDGKRAWTPSQSINSVMGSMRSEENDPTRHLGRSRLLKSAGEGNRNRRPSSPDLANLKKLAEGGDPKAQFVLGVRFDRGEGVEQNQKEAVRWWRKSAESGDADSQVNLSWMYEAGQGVEQNDEEAVLWCRKAADQGNATALCNLGWLYETGRGVERDDREAARLYACAAAQGNERAKKLLKRPGWRAGT